MHHLRKQQPRVGGAPLVATVEAPRTVDSAKIKALPIPTSDRWSLPFTEPLCEDEYAVSWRNHIQCPQLLISILLLHLAPSRTVEGIRHTGKCVLLHPYYLLTTIAMRRTVANYPLFKLQHGGKSIYSGAWPTISKGVHRTTGVIGKMRGTIVWSQLRSTCISQSKSSLRSCPGAQHKPLLPCFLLFNA